jgi:hypothetical protein
MHLARLLAPVTLAAVMLQPQNVCAYRPFDLTDADVVEYRGVELEIGPVALQRSSEDLVLIAPSLIVNYGIRPRLELVLEGKNERSLRSSSDNLWRPQEFAASIKWLVRAGSLQGERGLSIATEPSVLLPGRDQPGVGAQVGVILSVLGPAGALHLNVVPGISRAHNLAGTIGIIAEGPFDWRIRPVGEWVAYEEVGAGWLVSMLYGFIVRAGEGCSFDGAIRAQRIQGLTTLEVRAGLTWSFGS